MVGLRADRGRSGATGRCSHEPTGWKAAEKLTPVAYIAWSLWLIGTGVVLVI